MEHPPIPGPARRWLPKALAFWQAKGVISSSQADQVLALLPPDIPSPWNAGALVMYALASMAAVLFGASILLVVGYNWQGLTREAKLAIMLAAITFSHAAGYTLERRWKNPLAADIVHFLGCFVYGAGIWLVAQAWNINSYFPDGMLWWALGVLPLVMASGTFLLHLLYAGLLATWCAMEILAPFGQFDVYLMGFGGFPHGAYALPLLVLPGFFWAYRGKSPLLLGLQVPLVAWWCVLEALAWRANAWTIFWVGGVGSVLLMSAQAHRRGDLMAIPYRLWGVVLVTACLLVIGSDSFWKALVGGPQTPHPLGHWVLCAVLLALVCASLTASFLLALRARGADGALSLVAPGSMGIGISLFGFLGLVGEPAAVPAMIFANVSMLALFVLLVRVGVAEGRLVPFSAGIAGFLLWTLVRYLDLFIASGGMLGAAALFALAGLALLAVGRFWMTRGTAVRPPDTGLPAAAWPDWTLLATAGKGCRRPWALAVAVAIQLGVVGGMVAVEEASMANATLVRLRVVQVYFRDIPHGDLLELGYETAEIIRRDLPGARTGELFVTLVPGPQGRYMVPSAAGRSAPETGVFLRGRYLYSWKNSPGFGIEAFNVQEGEGKRWESAIRNRRVFAEVLVAPNGKARIRGLVEEPGPQGDAAGPME